MRLCEIERPKIYRTKKTIPLKTIHKWKCRKRKYLDWEAKRAPLLAAMYGQGDANENALKAIELEKEMLELEALRAEQGTETYQAIKRLSRSAMRKRKK
jgi:hypothetical protein